MHHPTIRHQGNQQGLLASGKSSSVICKDCTVAKRCLEKYSFRLSLMTLRQKVCLPHPSPCHSNSRLVTAVTTCYNVSILMSKKTNGFQWIKKWSVFTACRLTASAIFCFSLKNWYAVNLRYGTTEFQTVSHPPKAFGLSHQPSNLWGSFERPCLVASSVIICIPVSL